MQLQLHFDHIFLNSSMTSRCDSRWSCIENRKTSLRWVGSRNHGQHFWRNPTSSERHQWADWEHLHPQRSEHKKFEQGVEVGLHTCGNQGMLFIVCSPPFKRGGTQILKISKRGGEPEKKFWGGGNQKGGERFSKKKGGTQLFKLNLGIEKNKNEDL